MKIMTKYPTEEECRGLLEEYRVPGNIMRHISVVTRVAVFLARRLKSSGIAIDIGLVRAGASLHDIARTVDIKDLSGIHGLSDEDKEFYRGLKDKFEGKRHNMAGYELFMKSYPELARIIRSHAYSSVLTGQGPSTWEEKVVYYSDKRVSHDRIVSAVERNKEGMARWKKGHPGERQDNERTEKINARIRQIEDEIFSIIRIGPGELQIEMENEEMRS